MSIAGIERCYVILREGKWDIPERLLDGNVFGLNLAYLVIRRSHGTPYTLDFAWPFIQAAYIAMGFPDILFQPADAFSRMLSHQSASKADIVLGLFQAGTPSQMDMVETDVRGRVLNIVIKPESTSLVNTWILAVWSPVFSRYMHDYLARKDITEDTFRELYVGHVIQSAITDGLKVESVLFEGGRYLDIGTPEDLQRAAFFSVRSCDAEDSSQV